MFVKDIMKTLVYRHIEKLFWCLDLFHLLKFVWSKKNNLDEKTLDDNFEKRRPYVIIPILRWVVIIMRYLLTFMDK